MRHPYEKFIRLELLTLGIVIITGVISIVKGYPIIMILSLYLLSISIFCEALIGLNTQRTTKGAKQFAKAFMLFLLTTVLFFQL